MKQHYRSCHKNHQSPSDLASNLYQQQIEHLFKDSPLKQQLFGNIGYNQRLIGRGQVLQPVINLRSDYLMPVGDFICTFPDCGRSFGNEKNRLIHTTKKHPGFKQLAH